MHIHLKDDDIFQMPEELRSLFLNWLPKYLKTKNFDSQPVAVTQQCQPKATSKQLSINFAKDTQDQHTDNSHIRLSQLFDAGITKRGMSVRVKLTRKLAMKRSCDYINSLEISAKGTILYNQQEFDKPSPLAAKINEGSCNGWEYIEVKISGNWIRLAELREIWRKNNG